MYFEKIKKAPCKELLCLVPRVGFEPTLSYMIIRMHVQWCAPLLTALHALPLADYPSSLEGDFTSFVYLGREHCISKILLAQAFSIYLLIFRYHL